MKLLVARLTDAVCTSFGLSSGLTRHIAPPSTASYFSPHLSNVSGIVTSSRVGCAAAAGFRDLVGTSGLGRLSRSPELVDELIIGLLAKRVRYPDLVMTSWYSTGAQQRTNKPQAWTHQQYRMLSGLKEANDSLLLARAASLLHRKSPVILESSSSEAAVTAAEKQDGSVRRHKSQVCTEPGCKTHASFNWEGVKHRRFCAKHKLPGMVNVGKNTCKDEMCNAQPHFNVEGMSRGQFCAKHKHLGMVDVVSQRCDNSLCMKKPRFNMVGASRGLFCSAHKQPGMIDVISSLCEHDLCMKSASFNLFGETRGRFCRKHKQSGMLNVISKLCEEEGCRLHPSIGLKRTKQRRYCALHKLPGMVRVIRSSTRDLPL